MRRCCSTTADERSELWLKVFPYTRSGHGAALAVVVGCTIPLIAYYLSHHETLTLRASAQDRLGVWG